VHLESAWDKDVAAAAVEVVAEVGVVAAAGTAASEKLAETDLLKKHAC
jgi:hypothetical protein